MDSTRTDEQRDIRGWVRTFVRLELLLLQPEVLTRERAHEPAFARASVRRSATWGEPGVALASAAPGYPGEEELLGRYQQDSGRDLSDLGFYIALACFKPAVILEGIRYRYLHGQTVAVGYEHVGALAEPLAKAGLTALKASQELECQAAGLICSRWDQAVAWS